MELILTTLPGIISASTALIKLFMGGGSSKTDLERMKLENGNLRGVIESLQRQITTLEQTVQKDITEQKEISSFLEQRKINIRYVEKFGFIGPKGSGKTSFIWMHGFCPKPEFTTGDGTVLIQQWPGIVDTVGVQMTLEHLLRVISLFIIHGMPDSVYLFYTSQRIDEPILLLSLLGISQSYFVSLDTDYIYETYKDSEFPAYGQKNPKCYKTKIYDHLRKTRSPLIPIMAGEKPVKLNIFKPVMERLFPKGYANFSEVNTKDQLSVMRYRICTLIYNYYNKYDRNDLNFMNEII